jgi:hypothetical protein
MARRLIAISQTMKILIGGSWATLFLLVATGFAFAGPFKSRIITNSPLTITVPDDHFFRAQH